MIVYGTTRQKVEVNPLEVLNELLHKELPFRDWVFEKEGKFYHGWEDHRMEDEKEITKQQYEYIKLLQKVIKEVEDRLLKK